MKTSNNTVQVNGNHYDFEIEPVDIMVILNLNWFQGEILKYVSRHKRKNGISDINKAIHICDMAIDLKPKIFTNNNIYIDKYDTIQKYINQFRNQDKVFIEKILISFVINPWYILRDILVEYRDISYGK